MNTLDLLFDWLLQASLRASLLTLVVLPLQWTLRKHLSARLLHALWLPVLIVALLPVWPQSRWSAQSLIMDSRPAITSALAASELPAPVAQDSPAVIERSPSLSLKQIGALVWLAGALGLTVVGLASLKSTLRRFRRQSITPDVEVSDMVAKLAGQVGLLNPPRLCQSTAITSPAVAGLFRPILLLPSGFPQTFSTHEARLVLKHELMHLKRGDMLMNALLCLLMALHWFNPLLWFAFHKARIDREAACDEDVLRHGTLDDRATYGHALLKAESAFCPRGWSLGFVGIFERGAGLRTRIQAIASPGSHHPQVRLFACILMALMTYLGSTQAQPSGPEKKGTQVLIDTKLGPDLGQGSESVKSRSDLNGPAVVMEVQIIEMPTNDKLKLLSGNITQKKDITVMTLPAGSAARQSKMLMEESGGKVTSWPRIYTVSGNECRIETKKGGEPFVNDTSFAGTRCTFLPTIRGKAVDLDVKIEHATTPGQSTITQTTESLENGASILMGNFQATAGRPNIPLFLITLAWNAEEGPVAKKLQSIILQRVQFSDAALVDALEFFRVKARTLDTSEPEVSKRGVNIVLKTAAAANARINLDLKDVPLEAALKYTAELANLEYWIEGSAVVFVAKAKVKGDPDKYIAAKGEAVEKAIQLILPQVHFSGASLEEALEFLSAQLRGREDRPNINLILKPGGNKATISLDLKDVPLWEAVRYVAELSNHTLSADDHSIMLTPK